MQHADQEMQNLSDLVRIVRATWHDVGTLVQLDKRCFQPIDTFPWYEFLGLCIWPGVIALKAVANGQPIGFIAGDPRHREGYTVIVTIGVDPDWRGRGIGEQLMREVEVRSPRSVPRFRLMVRKSNAPAIGLYRKLNYAIVDTWPGYYGDGEEAYVMEKDAQDRHRDSSLRSE